MIKRRERDVNSDRSGAGAPPRLAWRLGALIGLWLGAVGAGTAVLMNHQNTPGRAAAAGAQWPTGSGLQPAPGRATLIMMGHPQCPCTRASIGELALLMARCQGRVTAYVVFLKPPGVAPGWEQTDLWRSAAAIPGVQVLRDDVGQEARRFHVTTSGQTLLFNSAGHLLFSGGITGSRGHAGDNDGRDAVVSLLTTGTAKLHTTPVYGCSLMALNPQTVPDSKAAPSFKAASGSKAGKDPTHAVP